MTNGKIKQTKENKQKFDFENEKLLNIMQPYKVVELQTVMSVLNVSNRKARDLISKLALFHPVISLSDSKGYIRLGEINELNNGQTQNYLDAIDRQINDFESRIKVLKKRQRSLIAWCKMAEKLKGAN